MGKKRKSDFNNKSVYVMIFDSNFLEQFLISLESITNLNPDSHFFIATDKAAYEYLNKLAIVKMKLKKNQISLKILEHLENKFDSKGLFANISLFTYGRFLLEEIFGNDLYNFKSLIFLDADTVLISKINKRYLDTKDNFVFVEGKNRFMNFFFNKTVKKF